MVVEGREGLRSTGGVCLELIVAQLKAYDNVTHRGVATTMERPMRVCFCFSCAVHRCVCICVYNKAHVVVACV